LAAFEKGGSSCLAQKKKKRLRLRARAAFYAQGRSYAVLVKTNWRMRRAAPGEGTKSLAGGGEVLPKRGGERSYPGEKGRAGGKSQTAKGASLRKEAIHIASLWMEGRSRHRGKKTILCDFPSNQHKKVLSTWKTQKLDC